MIFSRSNIANPYPTCKQKREEVPIQWDEDLNAWLVLDHTHIAAAFKNPDFSSNRVKPFLEKARGTDLEPVYETLSLLMLQRDEPDHTRLRNLVHFAFKRTAVETYEDSIRDLARSLLPLGRKSGEMEFVGDFAVPLPIRVISEIVGIPEEDREMVKRLCDGFSVVALNFYANITEEELEWGRQCIQEFSAYMKNQIELRRKSPTSDLLSSLVHAEEDGHSLSFEEVVANTLLLLNAGNETTTCLLANGVKSLLQNPSQFGRLKQDLSLVRTGVEELLRYESPVQFIGRKCARDMEFGDKLFRKDDMVLLVLAEGGRDPAVFDNSDRLDVTRHPNHHLSFGTGPHLCAGVQLARLEARIAFEEILAQFSILRLVSEDIPYGPNVNLRCPSELRLYFET